MTVKQLMQELGPAEIQGWLEYYRLEPFGQARGDMQAGIVASMVATVANSLGGGKGKLPEPSDFMLEFKRKAETSDPAKTVQSIISALGGLTNGSKHKRSI